MSELSLFDPGQQIRRCRNCNVVKPIEEFSPHGKYRAYRCKRCEADRSLARYHADPDGKAKSRDSLSSKPPCTPKLALLKKFGITADEFDERAAAQGHVCAICSQPCPTDEKLRVDHDHQTGVVRGLLCHACNVGLGMFRDNPDTLMAAAAYLLHHTDLLCQQTKGPTK